MKYLELADALRVVYEYGFELAEEHFVELTDEQYASLARQGGDVSKRWFRISRGVFEDRNNPPDELSIVSEDEKARIFQGIELVYRMSEKSGRTFADFRARLGYLRGRLPPSITGHGEPNAPLPARAAGRREAEEPEPQQPHREEHPLASVHRYLDKIRALQDEGHVEAARDQLIDFILWQSNLEAQLEAVKLLARRPTHRSLDFLNHIYRHEYIDRDDARMVVYPRAPSPLGEAMTRPAADLGPEAHRVVRSAVQRAYAELARAAASGGTRELEDLIRVVRPPESSIDAGPEDSEVWRDVEFRLGLELPADLKRVIEAYGSGAWGSALWTLNPFSRDPDLNLERRAHDLLGADHRIRRGDPRDIPFALYPEKHGLFPWAVTAGGSRLYYLTEGPVQSWQIIAFEAAGSLYDRHRTTATDFLFRFVNGAVASRVLGALESEYRWTFRPAGRLKAVAD